MQTYTPPGGRSPASGFFASLPHTNPKTFRQALGDEIERLIDVLDALDGDTDLEPDLAGAPNDGAACDAEGDDCDLERNGDDEPSLGGLGGTAMAADGQGWGSDAGHDLEECVPTGFRRVRRALAEELRETEEETRRIGAILRRLKVVDADLVTA